MRCPRLVILALWGLPQGSPVLGQTGLHREILSQTKQKHKASQKITETIKIISVSPPQDSTGSSPECLLFSRGVVMRSSSGASVCQGPRLSTFQGLTPLVLIALYELGCSSAPFPKEEHQSPEQVGDLCLKSRLHSFPLSWFCWSSISCQPQGPN